MFWTSWKWHIHTSVCRRAQAYYYESVSINLTEILVFTVMMRYFTGKKWSVRTLLTCLATWRQKRHHCMTCATELKCLLMAAPLASPQNLCLWETVSPFTLTGVFFQPLLYSVTTLTHSSSCLQLFLDHRFYPHTPQSPPCMSKLHCLRGQRESPLETSLHKVKPGSPELQCCISWRSPTQCGLLGWVFNS